MAQDERLDHPAATTGFAAPAVAAHPDTLTVVTDRGRRGELRELYSGFGETVALAGTALLATVALIAVVALVSWGWSGHRTPMVGLGVVVLATALGIPRLRRRTARTR